MVWINVPCRLLKHWWNTWRNVCSSLMKLVRHFIEEKSTFAKKIIYCSSGWAPSKKWSEFNVHSVQRNMLVDLDVSCARHYTVSTVDHLPAARPSAQISIHSSLLLPVKVTSVMSVVSSQVHQAIKFTTTLGVILDFVSGAIVSCQPNQLSWLNLTTIQPVSKVTAWPSSSQLMTFVISARTRRH